MRCHTNIGRRKKHEPIYIFRARQERGLQFQPIWWVTHKWKVLVGSIEKGEKEQRNMGHVDADPVCPVAMANYPYWEIIGHHGLQSMAVAQRWTVVVGHVGCRVVEGVYWQNDKQDKQFGFIFFC